MAGGRFGRRFHGRPNLPRSPIARNEGVQCVETEMLLPTTIDGITARMALATLGQMVQRIAE